MTRSIKARLPPFCDFHSGAIRFRMIVPKDLKECFTVSAFKISLMTANIPTARILSARLSCSLFEAFETIRQRKAALGMKLTAEQQTELVKRYLREVLQRDLQRRQQNDSKPVLPYGSDYTEKELTDIEELLSFSLNAQKNKEYSGLQDVLRPVVVDGARQLFNVELKEAEHSKAQIKANESATDRAIKEILAYHEITAENDEKEINALTFQLAQGLQRDVIPVMLKRAKGDFTAEQEQASAASQSDVIDVDSGPYLYEAIDDFMKHKQNQGMSKSTLANYNNAFKILKEITDDMPIIMLNKKAVREIADKFRDSTKSLKSLTLKNYQQHIRSFIRTSRINGYDFIEGIESTFSILLRNATAYKDEKKRTAFSPEQLRTIFSPEHYKFNADPFFASRYWLPLIAVFEGMRLGEICQLTTDDIKQDKNGITYIDVNDKGDKHVKTTPSRRRIPILKPLIDLGFIDYVEQCKSKEKSQLIEYKPTNVGSYNPAYFRRIQNKLNMRKDIDGNSLTFHSLRHSFATIARRNGIAKELIQDFMGHETGETTLDKSYIANAAVQELYDAFKDLHFPIDIEAIKRDWKAPEDYFSRKGKTGKKDDNKSE